MKQKKIVHGPLHGKNRHDLRNPPKIKGNVDRDDFHPDEPDVQEGRFRFLGNRRLKDK